VVNLLFSGALLFLGVSALGLGKNIAAVAAGILATPLSFLLARWAINSGATHAAQADHQPASDDMPPPGSSEDRVVREGRQNT
jgi:hypothetical protein